MKALKKVILLVLVVSSYSIFAEQPIYPKKIVAEYKNKRKPGELFWTDNVGPDGTSGNYITFSKDGKLVSNQFDQGYLYFFSDDMTSVLRTAECDSKNRGAGIIEVGEGIMRFGGGYVDLFDKEGKGKFMLTLFDFTDTPLPAKAQCFFHADILFFIDDNFKLHSVLHPSLDQEKNKANYRNPEQTKKLFGPGSDVDLKGLTIDGKGLMYLNGVFIGPGFMPVVGKWQYYMNPGSIVIGNTMARLASIPMPKFDEKEILESTAVHPSGDIYFLKYNKAQNKHILYKIENTWDLDAKVAWEKRKS